MRYIVIGLGAIGGTIAARLHMAGRDVAGVARGAHLEAIAEHGLLLRTPQRDHRVRLPVAVAADLEIRADDVVMLAVKSQDTAPVLAHLADIAPADTPIACVQNGVANEPAALRWFPRVYGVLVQCPCLHLEPGVVAAYSTPTVGILDVGRYPTGEEDVSRAVAEDLGIAGFSSRSVPDIVRWKYAKLITNLGNAVEVVCGPAVRGGELTTRLQDEARDILTRHGIAYASAAEDKARRADHLHLASIDGPRPGGSMWQSVTRGLPATEVDYLCGEVVRLARLLGADAPVNRTMQDLTHAVSRGDTPIAALSESAVLDRLG